MWSEKDRMAFLLAAYLGRGSDLLGLCISRAYRDMNRTMWGFAKVNSCKRVHTEAVRALERLLGELRDGTSRVASQGDFDAWRRAGCQSLINLHTAYGYANLSVGQAQKWINMTLKHLYILGEESVPGFARFFRYCHMPLDSVVLHGLSEYGFAGLSRPWSRLHDYEEYLGCQTWIRTRFEDPPLDVEFSLWMAKPVEVKATC